MREKSWLIQNMAGYFLIEQGGRHATGAINHWTSMDSPTNSNLYVGIFHFENAVEIILAFVAQSLSRGN